MRRESPNEEKFAELILYLAKRSEDDPWFGAVKLHKLLYYSEFRAYRERGKAITGQPFQNLEHGPAAKRLLPIQGKLVEQGDARVDPMPTTAGMQKRLVALREPDLSLFDPDELRIIDQVLADLRGMNATEVSELSHVEPGWLVTQEREPIPYHFALLTLDPLTDDDRSWAEDVIRREFPGKAQPRI